MLVANQRSINVGLGDIAVTKDTSVILTCNGLGSCIAMCVWDPATKSGGMAHMLLPTCRHRNDIASPPSKYVDSGAPQLINRMLKQGSVREDLIVKITGGARMLSIPGLSQLDIGQRNIAEIKSVMQREKLPILGEDLGGTWGRSVYFFLDSGRITVKVVNGSVIDL
jgi:chemotaxis protein CheD